MTTTIHIEEIKDPYSIAMKYIIRNLGINIRPGNYFFDKINKKHIVFLNAIISNEISPMKKASKSFAYIFKNIGTITLNEDMKHLKSSLSDELEKKIYSKFWKIHKKVENTIKEYGIRKWGRMGRIRTFLSPLYIIANRILEAQELDISDMKSHDLWKYIKPFLDNNLIVVDPHNEEKLVCSNYLKQLGEGRNQIETVEFAIGIIIARSSNYLVKELKNYSFITYIDVPKVYYLDAVEYGEMIDIPIKELINKYHFLGKRPYSYRGEMNLEYIITELVNAGLLTKDPNNDTISGVEPLFEKVFDFRDEILKNVNILNEGFV